MQLPVNNPYRYPPYIPLYEAYERMNPSIHTYYSYGGGIDEWKHTFHTVHTGVPVLTFITGYFLASVLLVPLHKDLLDSDLWFVRPNAQYHRVQAGNVRGHV